MTLHDWRNSGIGAGDGVFLWRCPRCGVHVRSSTRPTVSPAGVVNGHRPSLNEGGSMSMTVSHTGISSDCDVEVARRVIET